MNRREETEQSSEDDHSSEEKELSDVAWDMSRFDVDGNLQKIAGLKNNVKMLQDRYFKKIMELEV